MVPGGVPFEFHVTVVTRTEEEAEEVMKNLTAGPRILGDMTDPRSMPFPYIIDSKQIWKREPR